MLTSFWLKFQGWVVGAGVILLAILSIYSKGRSDGKSKAISDDREELRKDVQDKKQIEIDVSNDSDADLDKRVRRWVKN